MNVLITTSTSKVGNNAKGTKIVTANALKTKTNIEIQFDSKSRTTTDFLNGIPDEMKQLGISDGPLDTINVVVGDVNNIGKLVLRSLASFEKMDILVTTEMSWDAKAGTFTVSAVGAMGYDLGYLVEMISRLVARAMGALSGTQHPLTLFDLRQAMGIVYDVKQEVPGVSDLNDWMSIRALSHLEAIKADKKAKAAAARVEKTVDGKGKPKKTKADVAKAAANQKAKDPGADAGKSKNSKPRTAKLA